MFFFVFDKQTGAFFSTNRKDGLEEICEDLVKLLKDGEYFGDRFIITKGRRLDYEYDVLG